MKKILLSVLILVALPSIVSAVWWNPFTWFTPEPAPITTSLPAPIVATPTPVVKEQAKPVEIVKPVPKPVSPPAPVVAPKQETIDYQALQDEMEQELKEKQEKELDDLREDIERDLRKAEKANERFYELKQVCSSVDDDVRSEISSSGGMANERQVQALVSNRMEELGCFDSVQTYKIPTAICKDGTYSYSESRQGTCSWHNGVWFWY